MQGLTSVFIALVIVIATGLIFSTDSTAHPKATDTMTPLHDPAVLEDFKAAINYSRLQASLPQRPDIFIDWHDGFDALTVEGERWARLKETTPSIVGNHHALLSTHYVRDDVYVSVKVHVFSQADTQAVFDYMLTLMASTSLPEIPFSPVPAGPGDIHFAAAQMTSPEADAASYTLLANTILVVDTADASVNVRPFARELVSQAARKAENSDPYSPPEFSAAPAESDIHVGDTFAIDYQAAHLGRIATTLEQEAMSGTFETLAKTNDHVQLKALAAGDHLVPIRYMDVETLYSNHIDVPVVVSPMPESLR